MDNDKGNTVFESGAILLYLAKKYDKFLNKNYYWEIIQWLFFQMSYVGPMLGQAHQYLFYNAGKSKFAEEKSKGYTKHVYKILDERLSSREYIVDEYSVADISIWPWIARFERHQINLNEYTNVLRWYLEISNRTAVIKGYNVVGDYYEIPTV